jgi:hypothetical protein
MHADRAHIDWLDWSVGAFERARSERRPVLLSITTSWCPACRQMDGAAFADPGVAALVADSFVPVRVDAERRPDINERYNLGGWPTTAFLTPAGGILTGSTYLAPDRLRDLMRQVARSFGERRIEIETGEAAARPSPPEPVPAAPLAAAGDGLVDLLLGAYDEAYGGFDRSPKLPRPDALGLALALYEDRSDPRLLRLVTSTLDAMGWGAMYDDVEGGFFRYAGTRDWRQPHTAKSLDLNAALIAVYLDAWRVLGHRSYRYKATHALAYVHGTLADHDRGGFFAGQAADAAYYEAATAADRAAMPAPAVDRSQYLDQNAAMVSAYLQGARLLDDRALAESAIDGFDRLVADVYLPGQGVTHARDDPGPRSGLLVDQIRTATALLDAFDACGREPYLMLAQELVHYCRRWMWDEAGGGFFDRTPEPDRDIGLLRDRLKPAATNAEAARLLIRLATATGDRELVRLAGLTLEALAPVCRMQGLAAAGYGLALREWRAATKESEPRNLEP